MSAPLPFTGERFVPGAANAKGEMWYEHWHRYHFVLPLVAGKMVLDVACGEGYGSALMSRTAAQVTGVDISIDAIAHGKSAYADRPNLRFVEGTCTSLPFDAASFDVVVSFETIEHIHEQAEFLDEVRRVLKPDGVLIVSSPDRAEYSDKRGYANEFHVRELDRAELETLLAPRFSHTRWLSQRNAFVSLIAEDGLPASGESLTVSQNKPDIQAAALPALYHLAFAANDAGALAALPRRLSVFTDAEEWAYNDYRDTYKGFRHYQQRTEELERQSAALQAQLAALKAAQSTAPTAPKKAEAGSDTARVAPTTSGDSWLVRLIKRLSS